METVYIVKILFAKANVPAYDRLMTRENNSIQTLYKLLSKFWAGERKNLHTYRNFYEHIKKQATLVLISTLETNRK